MNSNFDLSSRGAKPTGIAMPWDGKIAYGADDGNTFNPTVQNLHSDPQLVKNRLPENSIEAPGRLRYRKKFTEYDLEGDLMNPEIIDKAKDWTERITDFFKLASDAAGKVFSQLGDITNIGINKTASSPMLVTVGAAGVGLVAGLKAVKNIIHGVSVAIDSKKDTKLGWLPYELLGILQGGLFFGLMSPFFGKRNFLTEFQDGKPVVKMKSITGLALACLGFSGAMNLAKGAGNSLLAKIPIIGPLLQQIFETIFGAQREVTVATPGSTAGAEQAVPAHG